MNEMNEMNERVNGFVTRTKSKFSGLLPLGPMMRSLHLAALR